VVYLGIAYAEADLRYVDRCVAFCSLGNVVGFRTAGVAWIGRAVSLDKSPALEFRIVDSEFLDQRLRPRSIVWITGCPQ
jgi:hypothetical protein